MVWGGRAAMFALTRLDMRPAALALWGFELSPQAATGHDSTRGGAPARGNTCTKTIGWWHMGHCSHGRSWSRGGSFSAPLGLTGGASFSGSCSRQCANLGRCVLAYKPHALTVCTTPPRTASCPNEALRLFQSRQAGSDAVARFVRHHPSSLQR